MIDTKKNTLDGTLNSSGSLDALMLSESVGKNAYETGQKIGSWLSIVHSKPVITEMLSNIVDGGTENPLPYGLHGFHDRCHRAIFYGAVARRVGAVQTTYLWQFVIQYLNRLEPLAEPKMIVGNIDAKTQRMDTLNIGDNIPLIIGDSLMDFGAIFRTGLDENLEFISGLKNGYTLDLPKDWVAIAKMLDLGWWLIEINRQKKGSLTIKPIVDTMLIAFAKLGAGNKNTFSYAVDTTALVQKRK